MRIRLAVPDELDDQDRKAALDAALECVTRTVEGLVRNGVVPPAAGEIKKGRVKWKPEPPGDEHFDLPSTVIRRGWGDCDDLAPWHAGSLRAGGIDPDARAIVKRSGPKRWHALVQRGDGSIEDPSKHAGMGHNVSGAVEGAGPPIHAPMSAEGRLCVAICPSRDRRHPLVWFARTDVPDRLEPWDWSSVAAHPDPAKALLKSVQTAQQVAGADMDPEDAARLGALNDLVCGAQPEEVAAALEEILGGEVDVGAVMDDSLHSVGFFGKLFKSIGKVATAPIKAVTHIPGVSNIVKAGLPLAAGMFGGPLGTAAAGLVTRGLFPGGGGGHSAAAPSQQTASPFPQGIPQLPPEYLRQLFLQQMQQPRFMWEPGGAVRPWGYQGPAVMRF